MSRSNNGVPSKVSSNVGKENIPDAMSGGRSNNRGDGQVGTSRDMGGAPNQMAAPLLDADMKTHHGPDYRGSEKDMGGVGDNKGTNGPANDFRGSH